MSNKKHIDRVFQEKLKDFEVSPSPKVWQNIKGELEQSDQDRKVFPIWLRLTGVAALLLILFTVGNSIINSSDDSNNNTIVGTENSTNSSESNTDNSNNKTLKELNNSSQKGVLTNVNSSNSNSKSDDHNITDVTSSSPSESNSTLLNNNRVLETINNELTNSNDVVSTKPSESNSNNLSEINDSNKTVSSEDKTNYASSSNKQPKVNSNTVAQRNNNEFTNQSSKVLSQNKDSEKENESNPSNINTSSMYSTPTSSEGVAQNENSVNGNENNSINNKSTISSTPTSSEGIAQNNSEKQNNNSNVISEFDKEKADAAINSSNKTTVAENESITKEQENLEEEITIDEEIKEDSPSIEEEIAKAEDIIEEEEKVNRWQVYANVAPVYYNTLGQGSHIDEQFVENSKSGEINTSYGVNVSYVINDKLKLRTGFNSLDLSYDTDNVILYENVGNNSDAAPRNINLNSSGQSFSAISATNLGAQQLGSGIGGNDNGAISQRIGYYEVPLELEYNLVDNKFGVNVIGGVSTFILNDNKVYSEFDGFKTEIGEANNINNVSFSGNLGLGLDYKFSDKIKLNVQPTFKYQLNAYKNTSGNFRPYIVGVYTGLSYKF